MTKFVKLLLVGCLLHTWVCCIQKSAMTDASSTSVKTMMALTTTITTITITKTIAEKPPPIFLYTNGYEIYPVYGANMSQWVTKGTRVIRGRDWDRGYEGKGGPGTIIDIPSTQEVIVHWDAGLISDYSMGSNGIYSLYLLAGEEACRYLVPPDYATVVYSKRTLVGSVARVSCFDGFYSTSNVYAECRTNGQWTRNLTACNSTSLYECGGIIDGSKGGTLTSPGYPYYSPDKLNCTWTITVPEMYGVRYNLSFGQLPCGDFIKVWTGRLDSDVNCHTTTSNVYRQTTSISNISVTLYTESARQYQGFMLTYKPECKQVTSPQITDTRSESLARFSCKTGYTLVGPSVLLCTSNATWNDSTPICQPLGCSNNTIILRNNINRNAYVFPHELLLADDYDECYWIVKGPDNSRVKDGVDNTSKLLARMCGSFERLSVSGSVARLSVSSTGDYKTAWSTSITYSAGCPYFEMSSRLVSYSNYTLPGSVATCTTRDLEGNRLSTICQNDYTWTVSNFTCGGCSGLINIKDAEEMIDRMIGGYYFKECIWILQALPDEKITIYVNNRYSRYTNVEIRDGADVTDALLLPGNFNQAYSYQVTSSGNVVRIHIIESAYMYTMNIRIKTGCAPMTLASGSIDYESYYRGTARFTCHSDYALVGPGNVTCLSNYTWSGQVPVCRRTKCRPILLNNRNISFTSSNSTYLGSEIMFHCESNWILVGPRKVTCTNSGEWSDTFPSCERTACGSLDVFGGDVFYHYELELGVYANIMCNEGYFLFGKNIIKCRANGTWDSQLPECLPDCGEVISNSTKGEISRGYPVPTSINETCTWIIQVDSKYIISLYVRQTSSVCCKFSYELYDGRNRDRRITASRNSPSSYVTTGPAARVVYVNSGTRTRFRLQFKAYMACRMFESLQNVTVNYNSYGRRVGGIASFTCAWPTVLVGSKSSLQCLDDGEWDGDPPTCVDTGCYEHREFLTKTNVTYDSGTYYYTYSCSNGYATLIGPKTVACKKRSFVGQLPTCEYIGCELSAPKNGTLDSIATSQDGYLFTYKCDNGFYLVGNSTRICSSFHVWLSDAPVCFPYVQDEKTVQNTGLIVGGVLGGIVGLALIGVIVGFGIYRNRKKGPNPVSNISDVNVDGPISRKRPVKLSEFPAYLDAMHRDLNQKFSRTFEDLKALSPSKKQCVGNDEKNKTKNREMRVIPFDQTRVKLGGKKGTDDYINASILPGYLSPCEYIGCQGPLPGTINDFWRMVWEQNVSIVVMLTLCMEEQKVTSEQYWPRAINKPQQFGDVIVKVTSHTSFVNYDHRVMKLDCNGRLRTLEHFQFLGWLKMQTNDALLNFISKVRSQVQRPETSGPIIVHCSNGAGRTGTYIVLDQLMQFMEDHDFEASIDIFDMVLKLRENRPHMVQTEQQYEFIHDCVKTILNRKIKGSSQDNTYETIDALERNVYQNL